MENKLCQGLRMFKQSRIVFIYFFFHAEFDRNMLGVNHRFAKVFVFEMHRAVNILPDPMKLSYLKPLDLINVAVGGGFVR